MNQTAAAASTSRNSICTRKKEGSTSHKEEHRGEQNRLGYMFSHKEMTEIPSTKAKEYRKQSKRATKNGFFLVSLSRMEYREHERKQRQTDAQGKKKRNRGAWRWG
jgi:hypothetical protein